MVPPLSPETFSVLTGVSRETLDRMACYVALLAKWQAKINLVSNASLQDTWRRHILDAAQLWVLITGSGNKLVDIGSGAGLPGLVLAILGLENVTLVESDGRKCAFLQEAARITGTDVEVIHGRVETAVLNGPASIVTGRGFAPLPNLLELASAIADRNTTYLLLKGRNTEQELTAASKCWTLRAERFPSISDPSGTVLRLTEVVRGNSP